jgi:predicted nucleotidyltransferase
MADAGTQILEFPALRDPRFPIHKASARLEPYLRAIVEKIHPQKIILFGSYAYGEPRWDSDFDLLVLRNGISSSMESNIEIRTALWDVDAAPVSFTFLSQTPEWFAEKLEQGSFIYTEIATKGVVLYAA